MVCNLYEQEFINTYVVIPKCLIWLFSLLSIGLLVGSFFKWELVTLLFFGVFMIVFSTLVYIFNKRKYARKVLVEKESSIIYENGRKFSFERNTGFFKKMVIFNGPGFGAIKKETIIICNSKEILEELKSFDIVEHRSYWKNNNVIFIQNPELISIIENCEASLDEN